MGAHAEREVRAYVAEKGWRVLREAKRELWLEMCPFCRTTWSGPKESKFSISLDSGACKCFRASCDGNAGQNLWTLKKVEGDMLPVVNRASHEEEQEQEKLARQFRAARKQIGEPRMKALEKAFTDGPGLLQRFEDTRGLNEATVRRFRLGFEMKGRTPWLVMPYLHDGKPVLLKKRNLKAKPDEKLPKGEHKWEREPAGAPSLLFNADALKTAQGSTVYVAEAELDAMAAEQLGFEPCVASSTGAGAFDKLWRRDLERFDRIVFLYDPDDAGDEGAINAAQVLGSYRCWRAAMETDVSKYLIKHGPNARSELAKAIREATRMGGSGIIHIADALDMLYAHKAASDAGVSFGLPGMDDVFGGLRNELVIVSGDTGVGKTTFLTALQREQVRAGHPALYIGPEMEVVDIARKHLVMHTGVPMLKIDTALKASARQQMERLPLWIGDMTGYTPLSKVRNTIEAFIRRHGGRSIWLDHLDFFLDPSAADERREIDKALFEIATWCKMYGVSIILVVHPNKLRTDRMTGSTKKITMNDLRGSSKIKQLGFTIMLLHRGGKRARNTVEVEDAKVRWDGVRIPGPVKLEFCPSSMRYTAVAAKAAKAKTKADGKAAAAGDDIDDIFKEDDE
jgi:hypothetical protein